MSENKYKRNYYEEYNKKNLKKEDAIEDIKNRLRYLYKNMDITFDRLSALQYIDNIIRLLENYQQNKNCFIVINYNNHMIEGVYYNKKDAEKYIEDVFGDNDYIYLEMSEIE